MLQKQAASKHHVAVLVKCRGPLYWQAHCGCGDLHEAAVVAGDHNTGCRWLSSAIGSTFASLHGMGAFSSLPDTNASNMPAEFAIFAAACCSAAALPGVYCTTSEAGAHNQEADRSAPISFAYSDSRCANSLVVLRLVCGRSLMLLLWWLVLRQRLYLQRQRNYDHSATLVQTASGCVLLCALLAFISRLRASAQQHDVLGHMLCHMHAYAIKGRLFHITCGAIASFAAPAGMKSTRSYCCACATLPWPSQKLCCVWSNLSVGLHAF